MGEWADYWDGETRFMMSDVPVCGDSAPFYAGPSASMPRQRKCELEPGHKFQHRWSYGGLVMLWPVEGPKVGHGAP